MCWSTGRAPMAQPPGSDTRAVPKRATSGPSTRIDARMVFTMSYGASVRVTASAFRRTVAPSRSAATPIWRSSFSVVTTSCSCGTLSTMNSSGVSRLAARIGSAAFFAPEIVTSPPSGLPPRILSLSMARPATGGRGR